MSAAAVEGLSGAAAGIIALVLTYPLMTVTTLQATRSKQKKAKPSSSSSIPARRRTDDAVTATTTPTALVAATAAAEDDDDDGSSPSSTTTTTSSSAEPPPMTIAAGGKKTGTFAADVAEIVAARGWRGLYAGLRPSLLGTAVSQGVYFYLYSALRDLAIGRATTKLVERESASAAARAKGRGATPAGVAAAAAAAATAAAAAAVQQPPALGVPSSLLVAALAGCGNVLLTNPIWVVATRMQASARGPTSPALAAEAERLGLPSHKRRRVTAVGVARELYNEGGVRALWRGVAPSLVMVSNPTVNYMLYEWIAARMLSAKRNKQRAGTLSSSVARRAPGGGGGALVASSSSAPPPLSLGAADVFLASALAKLGATVVTYPILLVKARLQSAGAHTAADRKYKGTADAIARIWAADGVAGFYEGLGTKITQSILAAAVLMMIKEEVSAATRRVLLGRQQQQGRLVVAAGGRR